ncbi:MAG: type I restriction enzyme R subunit [Akkermansiaceae bacterium]|jgi:type I restriction enzyme R subunit
MNKFTEAQLEAYSAADLYKSNKAIMRLVSDGFHLKRERTLTPGPSPKGRGESGHESSSPFGRSGDEGRSQRDLYIQLIDYSELVAFREPNPGEVPSIVAEDPAVYGGSRNIFKIVNQLEIVGHEKRIPDGILYINGLPLVVFEFKSAIREEATIHHRSVTQIADPERSPDLNRNVAGLSFCFQVLSLN